jgi:DtxR family Mn-dependent transcriptional regulator
MGSPLLIIVVLVVLVGGTVALWWPGTGLLRRGEHHASRERILTEDALKHIYHGEYRGQTASLPSVAGALQVSLTRAVELAERMQTAGLVTLRDGRLILETGVAPTEWHAKAERREHTMTPEEIDALENKLGHPRFDPHGDPIPTSDGAIRENPIVPLSSLEVGERAHVVHIEDEPEVVFAQLVAIGTYLGMVVHINGKTDERIVFEADGRSYVLAPLLAANISIQRLDAAEASEREGSALTLAELEPGEVAEVDRVSPACRGIERRRLMDLGIVPGTRVEFERRGLTGGLSAYRVRGTLIALRKEQADMISVNRIHEVTQ